MPAPTKVILSVLGLLAGVLVVYYGFIMPVPTADLSTNDPSLTAGTGANDGNSTPGTEGQGAAPLEPIDDDTTRPRGMFSTPVASGGLDPVSASDEATNGEPIVTSDNSVALNDSNPRPGEIMMAAAPPASNQTPTAPERAIVAIPVDYTIRSG